MYFVPYTYAYIDKNGHTCVVEGSLAWQEWDGGINCPAFYTRLIRVDERGDPVYD